MQKLLSTLFSVVFSFSIIVPSTSAAPSLLTYEDQELGFKLRYPSSMQVSKTPFEEGVEVDFMTNNTRGFLVSVRDFTGTSSDVRSWDTSSITEELATLEQESTVKKIYSHKVIKVGKQDAYISTYLITNRQTKKSSNAVFVATSANGKLYRMKYSYKDKDVNAASIYVDMMRSIQFFVGTLSTTTNSSSSSEQDVQNSNQSPEPEEQKMIPEENITRETVGKKTYVNTAYGMSFTYPESRTLSEEDNDGYLGVTLEDESYYLYITLSDFSKEKEALDLVEISNAWNAEVKATLQKDGATNIQLASSTKTIKGNKARYSVITMKNKEQQTKVIVRIITFINNRSYVFNMWADTEADAKLQMQDFLKNLKLPKNRTTPFKSTNNTSEKRSGNNAASIQTYSNAAYEFSFTYPGTRTLSEEEEDGNGNIMLKDEEGYYLYITFSDNAKNKGLLDVKTIANTFDSMVQEDLQKQGATNLKIVTSSRVIQGNDARYSVFTMQNKDGQTRVIVRITMLINNRIYVLNMWADTEADAKFRMEDFLKTVKLPKNRMTPSQNSSENTSNTEKRSTSRSKRAAVTTSTYTNTEYGISFNYFNDFTLSEDIEEKFTNIKLQNTNQYLNIRLINLMDKKEEINLDSFTHYWISMSRTEYSENGAINVKVTKAPYVLNGNRAYSILFTLLNEKTQKQVVVFELATMINNRGYVFTVLGDTEEGARRQMESLLKTLKLPKDNGTQSSEKSTA